MFGLFDRLKSAYTRLSDAFRSLFSKNTIDQSTLDELEKILIAADVGTTTTKYVLQQLRDAHAAQKITSGRDLRMQLETILITILTATSHSAPRSSSNAITLLVGINGAGKTTLAAKLAYKQLTHGMRPLLVAADTFRAAAREQLTAWAQALSVGIHVGVMEQDPASVVFAGCQQFQSGACTTLIIDTAGRLHTKVNLIHELAKIRRTITKVLPHEQVTTLLIIDATLGQNSVEQAKVFKEATAVDGIVLTKMDGTSKGGALISIAHELAIPIHSISYGERVHDYAPFNAPRFVRALCDHEESAW